MAREEVQELRCFGATTCRRPRCRPRLADSAVKTMVDCGTLRKRGAMPKAQAVRDHLDRAARL